MKINTKNPLYLRIEALLLQLEDLLSKLSDEEYSFNIHVMDNASIGQHVRHIIEIFEVMISGHESANINYDSRPRHFDIESNRLIAVSRLQSLCLNVLQADKTLILVHTVLIADETFSFDTISSYRRELVYNIEHTVHHLALIKIAVNILCPNIELPQNFGYADSTIINRNNLLNNSPITAAYGS